MSEAHHFCDVCVLIDPPYFEEDHGEDDVRKFCRWCDGGLPTYCLPDIQEWHDLNHEYFSKRLAKTQGNLYFDDWIAIHKLEQLEKLQLAINAIMEV